MPVTLNCDYCVPLHHPSPFLHPQVTEGIFFHKKPKTQQELPFSSIRRHALLEQPHRLFLTQWQWQVAAVSLRKVTDTPEQITSCRAFTCHWHTLPADGEGEKLNRQKWKIKEVFNVPRPLIGIAIHSIIKIQWQL